MPGNQRDQAHVEWLRYIEVSGPFLSIPVLTAEWPDLESLDEATRDRLLRAHRRWRHDPDERATEWIIHIVKDLLGWAEAVSFSDDFAAHSHVEPEHDTVITPTFGLRDPATGDLRLLGLISDDSPVWRVKGSDWTATPADRLAILCRQRGVELGLATNGRWWALVWAPAQGITTVAVFDSLSWAEAAERLVVRAFLSLLQSRRFFAVPPERQLPGLLGESLRNQEAITDRLGVQVRQAVELLVAAFGRIGVPPAVTAAEVYQGAVTMLMRLFFLFYAEAVGVLPADERLYAASYSVTGLYEELERQVADARGNEAELDHTSVAWHRILALCTIVDRGVGHQELQFAGHDGSLFDSARHPWLPLSVDDRTVLHLLRSVQTVTIAGERRTVSYRAFSVEELGYAYEGLLAYQARRADRLVVGLVGKDGREANVPLDELEALGQADLPARLAERYKAAGIGSPRALVARLAPMPADELARAESRLFALTQNLGLVRRLLPWYGIIRRDLRGDPVVLLPGQLYVTESKLRAGTGAHYTPRPLAERVVEGALQPLVYHPGPLQTADRAQWQPVGADDILRLRVADIAMGSGVFLVAACRYLADRLVDAWSREGDPEAELAAGSREPESGLYLDVAAPPIVIAARRLVAESCLYGADINEAAVQMAKLSLWLFSVDREHPFTFLEDRLVVGDSLLGITAADQLTWMHWDPAEGQALHGHVMIDATSQTEAVLSDAAERRRGLTAIASVSLEAVQKKREILLDVRRRTATLTRYANLLSGAALTSGRWATAVRTATEAAATGKAEMADEQAARWLRTDQPDGAINRVPLHWPLAFSEVFARARPGFDAIVGNPPFLGGQKMTGHLGAAYREFLVAHIANGARGSADLAAYFLLRVHSLLSTTGQAGLIATNTIAEGDTRQVGLGQVLAAGTEIRRATKSEPWGTRHAAVGHSTVWITRQRLGPNAERILDGAVVAGTNASLDPVSRVSGAPQRLAANAGISFQGAIVLGLGFTMPPERARDLIGLDPRNEEVLFPYLNGQDLNSRPDCSGSRWAVNFHDWPTERAATYPEPYAQVVHQVKPERDSNNRKVYRDYWWQYAEKRPAMLAAIAGLDRVIAITLVSKVAMPVMVPTGTVFSHMLGVFASDDTAMLALLSSATHYWWTIARASTLESRIRYTPSDVFETLPLPRLTEEMRSLGDRLDRFRRNLMLSRQAGLTATYNLVHDPSCADADIAELRGIHSQIDEATVRAYGWGDLAASLGHGFHPTRQGVRYTVAAAPRQEILDRLLELNHAQHAAEGRSGRPVRKGARRRTPDGELPLSY